MSRAQLTRWLAVAFGAFCVSLSVLASVGYRRQVSNLCRHVPGADLTGHFVLMGLLAFFAILGFGSTRIAGRRLGSLGCALVVAGLVTIDECIQSFVPARSFALSDLAASYAGIIAFGSVAWLVRRRWLEAPPAGVPR